MNLLLATVGKSPEPVTIGLRTGPVDHLVLFHSEGSKDVALKVKRQVEAFSGRGFCETVEIDPFDLEDIVGKIVATRERFPDAKASVNITGGTNVMASAALVACFILGADAYYIKEALHGKEVPVAEQMVRLPVPRVPLNDLDETKRAILMRVRESGGTLRRANSMLSQSLGKAPQLISYHLKKMTAMDLISMTLDGRDKVVSLTGAGRLFSHVLLAKANR